VLVQLNLRKGTLCLGLDALSIHHSDWPEDTNRERSSIDADLRQHQLHLRSGQISRATRCSPPRGGAEPKQRPPVTSKGSVPALHDQNSLIVKLPVTRHSCHQSGSDGQSETAISGSLLHFQLKLSGHLRLLARQHMMRWRLCRIFITTQKHASDPATCATLQTVTGTRCFSCHVLSDWTQLHDLRAALRCSSKFERIARSQRAS